MSASATMEWKIGNSSLVNSSARKSGRSPFSSETVFFCYKFYEMVVFGHFHQISLAVVLFGEKTVNCPTKDSSLLPSVFF